ncbi:2-amino-4-hydroxy-6-hydroxymethyldihydropteridine diphosphokinase [Carboxydothermus hydrogenoformans]|uniref:2-amino-4-hydroxy-6-hydroxymethyldihydropteridine diphosphokinase n=1 Tax=Carboxydothermus hydrogenoformans (strain ATCC BAA-161 / DSM 6008 / Z-2901) TaxID=246194 RepID=Q3A9K6_CARHZ|nr:2-amino-4-hydroxy-6-hydroxymethyldihydropteridine diphosphokinase [Carboxydothermus hydrogenoformans]ABB15673.1 2-amino-4-hydroxy-6-hydroxymethyldihydropteridine pyrophosphokinase [Carboxydothermus hydrogenoformans Z-2901]
MALAYIGIGTNLGKKEENIKTALKEIKSLPDTRINKVAALYETEPWGYAEQDWFLNTVCEIETALTPESLLEALLQIENKMGRVRSIRYGPRVIDLDLLWYEGEKRQEEKLTLPHPRITERAFVVLPLLELWPEAEINGVVLKSIAEKLRQEQGIKKFKNL